METTVVWRISDREPGRPTPYQRRLHALAQSTAGPIDDSARFCWVVARDCAGTHPPFYAAVLDASSEAEADEPAYLRLLDDPERAPGVAGDGLRAAARPAAPRAPSASSRSTSCGRTLAA